MTFNTATPGINDARYTPVPATGDGPSAALMRWLAPMHAIGRRLALVIVLNAFALTLPLTAVDLYVVRCT